MPLFHFSLFFLDTTLALYSFKEVSTFENPWIDPDKLGALLAVADVLLWRNKNVSAALLLGMTVIWFLFEVVEYNLVPLLCHISITMMLVLFIWSTAADILKWYLFCFTSNLWLWMDSSKIFSSQFISIYIYIVKQYLVFRMTGFCYQRHISGILYIVYFYKYIVKLETLKTPSFVWVIYHGL